MSEPLLQEPATIFLIIVGVLLLAPLLSERPRLPGIVGLIVSGILIGPNVFDLLESSSTMRMLGEVGLICLMFNAGLEVNLTGVRRDRGADRRRGAER